MSPKPIPRYVIKEILGKGGMGVVYRTYDNETRRDVTLKTLLAFEDPTSLSQFRKECEMLTSLSHPNIVDIYDIGEMEDDAGKRPYLVMPLLPGATLDRLIASSSQHLTVGRVADIMAQVCRGLQAAHERGLVHRDIKPSNIFVLEDDSVKIIDFGIAHLMGSQTSTAIKGTVQYMAPEQIRLEKPTPLSDLFSLGVVCYQALTGRRPFEGSTAEEVFQAILHQIPQPASELNPAVSQAVSQVIHKAMAKQPWQRFASVREFSEVLQKAARGEVLDIFDRARMESRIHRAQKALESGEYDYAHEVLGGLEAEGYLHPDMAPLRRRIDMAARERAVRQLLDHARRYFTEAEHRLAIQKVQEALRLEPENTEALLLKAQIENKHGLESMAGFLRRRLEATPEQPPEAPPPAPVPARRPLPWIYFSAGFVLLLGLVFFAVPVFRDHAPPPPPPGIPVVTRPAPPSVPVAPPTQSALIVQGALPGTQIAMDGKILGRADSHGRLSLTGVAAGEKRVVLRKKNYRTKALGVTVPPAGAAVLQGPAVVLERAEGLLIFEALEPRRIAMILEPSAGATGYLGPRQFPELPAQYGLVTGTYNLTFSAKGYVSETYTVQVSDRETKRIPIRLKKH